MSVKDKALKQQAPLREQIQNEVRNMLIKQILPAGSRIVESRLTEELGVSRTPLREALFKLEQEGFIKSDLAKGFTVNSLSSVEVKELYPIIWTLEGLAIQLGSTRIYAIVKDLKAINQEFAKAKGNVEKTIRFDTSFHETLTQECRNRHLINQLNALRRLILRYEFAYMQDENWIDDSIEQHNQIIEAIAKKDLNLVISVVEQNWRYGMEQISTWLDWVQTERKYNK